MEEKAQCIHCKAMYIIKESDATFSRSFCNKDCEINYKDESDKIVAGYKK